MKKIVTLLCVFLICSAFQCDDEPLEGEFVVDLPDINNPIDPTAGDFRVDFDGQTFVADTKQATIINEAINISGLRGSQGEILTITLQGDTEGTYQLGLDSGSNVLPDGAAYVEPNNTGSSVWVTTPGSSETQGQVLISSINTINKTISGTFSFTGTNASLSPVETKEFINGVFTDVQYATELPNNSENSFFAKVDGEEFVDDTIQATEASIPGLSSIGIVARKNNGETMSITLDSDISAGNYNFSTFSIPSAQYNLSSTLVNSGDGTLTISQHNISEKFIVGTFAFTTNPAPGSTGTQTYDITEGSFSVSY